MFPRTLIFQSILLDVHKRESTKGEDDNHALCMTGMPTKKINDPAYKLVAIHVKIMESIEADGFKSTVIR